MNGGGEIGRRTGRRVVRGNCELDRKGINLLIYKKHYLTLYRFLWWYIECNQ